MQRHTLELPPVRSLLTRGAHNLIEATAGPLLLFYLLIRFFGLTAALAGGLAWSGAAMLRRVLCRQRIPGVLILATGLLIVRSVLAFATGSVFIYFLQPTLGTFLVAGLFLASVRLDRPLAMRLAEDFCPLPEHFLRRPGIRRFFLRISLLWALVQTVNGAATLALLLHSSLGTLLIAKTVGSAALTAVATVACYLYFRSVTRAEGLHLVVRWRA
jgi:hypothetical protein